MTSAKYSVLLDACVLYPAPIRDLLLSMAAMELFRPKWSEMIQDEWQRNLLSNRPDLKPEQLKQAEDAMNMAFPDANVEGFKSLISTVELPDADDRHVVAAAIEGGADLILSFNIKDFPLEVLSKYALKLQTPDDFILKFVGSHPQMVCKAFLTMKNRLKNPKMSTKEMLISLKKSGLNESVKELKRLC